MRLISINAILLALCLEVQGQYISPYVQGLLKLPSQAALQSALGITNQNFISSNALYQKIYSVAQAGSNNVANVANISAQTPTFVQGSFAVNQNYQNNTGRPIMVFQNLELTNRTLTTADTELYIASASGVFYYTNVAFLRSSAGMTNSFTLQGLVTNTGIYVITNLQPLTPPLLLQSWYITY